MPRNLAYAVLALSFGLLSLSCGPGTTLTQTSSMLEDQEHKSTPEDKIMAESLKPSDITEEQFISTTGEVSRPSAMVADLEVAVLQETQRPQAVESRPLPMPVEPRPLKD